MKLLGNKHPEKRLLAIAIVLIAALPTIPPSLANHSSIQGVGNDYSSLQKVDPSLRNASGRVQVLLAGSSNMLREVPNLLQSFRAIPLGNDLYVIRTRLDASYLRSLAALPSVLSIKEDWRIEYDGAFQRPVVSLPIGFQAPGNSSVSSPQTRQLDRFEFGKPEAQLRDVVQLTGVAEAWSKYNTTGSNVTIALIDTGVDYSSLTLGYWDVIPRDQSGSPAILDADGESMVITNSTFSQTYTVTGRDLWLRTNESDPAVYLSFLAQPPYNIIPPVLRFSQLTGEKWPYAMNITGIKSVSGNFHFGILVKYYAPGNPSRPFLFFPILSVDSAQPGIYDTVYVDVSSAWATWSGAKPDLSFADEPPVNIHTRLTAARDLTGDGIYDVSAGTLGHFLDIWGASPNPSDRGQVLQPIDPTGSYAVLSDDWWGHGTYVAASAAGRDPRGLGVDPRVGPGMAPSAKVMGIVALFFGDILEAHLWAAGFDLIPFASNWDTSNAYGRTYGVWKYTGNHSAQIISNSWGISAWPLAFDSQPWYNLMATFQDALSVPGYLDPLYPGVTIVHAEGNGGPGYGTVTSPGYSSLSIGVGASTLFEPGASLVSGYSDQVISWSARGPTPLGTVKPDVVNVGAWAWVAGPTWSGHGNGTASFDVFGGTSMATPLTAGVAALLVEGYEKYHGVGPTPETVKSIIKSTARDLGYDSFVQGAGRVDALRTVSMAQSQSGIIFETRSSWDNIRQRIMSSWNLLKLSYGSLLKSQPPQAPIMDFGWYAEMVSPGSSTNTTFSSYSLYPGPVSLQLRPVTMVETGSMSFAGTTKTNLTGWLEGVGDLIPMSPSLIPPGTDLVVGRLAVNYTYFDPNHDFSWDRRFRLFFLDWNNTNGNGVPSMDQVKLVNYGYNTGTTVEARVGFPSQDFKGTPLIWVSQVGPGSVPYRVELDFYRREPWTWMNISQTVGPGSKSPVSIQATLSVPEGTKSGVYEGQLLITSSYDNLTSTLPISVVVPAAISSTSLSFNLPSYQTGEIYDPSNVAGLFDWRWRYESGDWRTWYFSIQDPRIIAAFVSSQWQGNGTEVDMFSINPSGILVGGTGWNWLGQGIFTYQTGGQREQFISLDATGTPGVHTVLLHNVLHGGSPVPETLTGKVQLVTLDPAPRGPIVVNATAGSVVSESFALSTGRSLTDVRVVLEPTNFNVDVTGMPRAILENSTTTFHISIAVPDGLPSGLYNVRMKLYSAEIFFGIPLDFIVNIPGAPSTFKPPSVSILAPAQGSFVKSQVMFRITAVSDTSVLKSSLVIEGLQFPLVWNPADQTWIGYVDTQRLLDGLHFVRAEATDGSGMTGGASTILNVDNTPPVISIDHPRLGESVKGTYLVEFNVVEDNPALVDVTVDGQPYQFVRDSSVTLGKQVYSLSFDSSRLSTGTHTVRVIAVDSAGNAGEESVMFGVTNGAGGPPPVAGSSYKAQILYPGLVGGALVGVYTVIRRARRRPKRSSL